MMLVTQQQPRWTMHSLCLFRLLSWSSSPPRAKAAKAPTQTCQGDRSILVYTTEFCTLSLLFNMAARTDAAAQYSLNLGVWFCEWICVSLCELKFLNSHQYASRNASGFSWTWNLGWQRRSRHCWRSEVQLSDRGTESSTEQPQTQSEEGHQAG